MALQDYPSLHLQKFPLIPHLLNIDLQLLLCCAQCSSWLGGGAPRWNRKRSRLVEEGREEGVKITLNYWNHLSNFPSFVCVCVCVCVLVTHSCPTLCDPMDCNPPGSSVHGILQQESWSGLRFSSPGNLPDPGVELPSPTLHTDSLLSEPPEKSSILNCDISGMLRGHISYGHT